MNRNARAELAKQTVAICDAGFHNAPNGTRVNIGNNPAEAAARALRWRDAGATQVAANSMGFGRRLPEEHIDAIARFKRAYDEAVRS